MSAVYIQFFILKDGTVDHVKVLKGIGGGCDEEAVRVVRMMPKWTPEKVDGEAVVSLFMLPVAFRLN